MSISIPSLTAATIKHCVLIKLTVNSTEYYISNAYAPLTYDGDSYQALGHFLNFSDIQNDLRITNANLGISLSGIPKDAGEAGLGSYNSFIQLILNENIKGSKVEIYRAFFDLNTLAIADVSLRFKGYISNYSITDSRDENTQVESYTVAVNCSSIHAVLEKRISGRRTNPTDQRSLYANDTGMDRVIQISNTSFDFGKPPPPARSTIMPVTDPNTSI